MLGAGVGSFNYSNTAEAEAAGLPIMWDSPPSRDGWLTLAAPQDEPSWFIVRYEGATAAAVLLHCHILEHQNNGMAFTMLQAQPSKEQLPQVPAYYRARANGEELYTPLEFGDADITIPVLIDDFE